MRHLAVLVAVIALLVVSGGQAYGTKPGPGTSTGTGRVFFPNPVAQLQDQTLTDQKDEDYAALQPAYVVRALTNLDGSGFLSGDWAVVVSETGNPAYSTTNTFLYNRSQDEFEQVMAYYWITEAQKYIQGLGFGSSFRAVNKEPQRVRINQWGVDNSFATTHKDELRFGKGGVDDAEDAEVILHEYGHAIHFSQNFSFASEEAGAISEGFADYWAVTVTDVVAQQHGWAEQEPLPCVADWDSTSYTRDTPHCLRRLDTDLHYPQDLDGEVHHDGQIWSRALWDIRQSVGHVKADTLILEGSMNFPGTTMPDLAQRTVDAAQSLYGKSVANQVRTAFEDRGIL